MLARPGTEQVQQLMAESESVVEVAFSSPRRAVAPGQVPPCACVCFVYSNPRVLRAPIREAPASAGARAHGVTGIER